MTIFLKNIKGSIAEMDNLFENAKKFSVRYFEMNTENDDWCLTIRCDEEIAPYLKRRRTLKALLKFDAN